MLISLETKRVLLTLLISLFILSSVSCDRLREGTVAPGQKAPQLELHDLDGKRTSLEDFKGKPVLLNFLASWCLPCAKEMPALEALSQSMKDKLTVVAVGVEDDDAALKDFRDRTKVTFPFLHDRTGYARARYRLAGYPETFILDKDGKLVMLPDPDSGGQPVLKFVGPRDWSSPQMKQILAAAVD